MNESICCVVNAHREGDILSPTLASVRRSVDYAIECGLIVNVCIVLDNSDQATKDVAYEQYGDEATIYEVDFKDLAYSRNFAVAKSTSDYMAFVDGDDLWSKTWLVDSFVMAERCEGSVVLHPEFNIFFGDKNSHVFNHVDMQAHDFEIEALYTMNYWTALSFARTDIYKKHPYRKNSILSGFGYEDWTWNYETISDGIEHRVVTGTVHFIRKGRSQDSLLAQTNEVNAVPRIMNIYRDGDTLAKETELAVASLITEANNADQINENEGAGTFVEQIETSLNVANEASAVSTSDNVESAELVAVAVSASGVDKFGTVEQTNQTENISSIANSDLKKSSDDEMLNQVRISG